MATTTTEDGEYRQVALIVGGASGIGAATAKLYAEHHHAVIIADRSADLGEALAASLRASGAQCTFLPIDVASEPSVQACVDAAIKVHGRIDSAINCAGVAGPMAPLQEVTAEQWQDLMRINLDGTFFLSKALVAYWLEQPRRVVRDDEEEGLDKVTQRGALVNIASVNSIVASKGMGAYVASKHGVSGISKSFALELANEGIRVNTVNPGCTYTPIMRVSNFDFDQVKDLYLQNQVMRRFAHPAEIANVVYYLNSDEASFCTGSEVRVDGGWTAH